MSPIKTTGVKPDLSLVKTEPIDQNIETIKDESHESIEYIDACQTTDATKTEEPKVNFNFIIKKCWELC